ncbi:TRAP transporter small permease [Acuticoccus sp. MNP-M23]|uniref:TRAP transporter small permease n=1 Tax=Acuticoccus sp. MNP-M23 TaxID=3072793 RepID=UPI002815C83D|nr:TRAP transporter small permease [Acuticoccus sp. MNP-M23]WMS44934.1 TRAP transporter small permease [Acuticoccus sp. MNP-M23]
MSFQPIGRWLLMAAAGILLVAMMMLTVVDVIGRYIFAAPVAGAFEATEVMLALAIFAGLPIVTARGEHVSVRLLVDRLPRRLQLALDVFSDLLVAVLLAGAAWLLYQRGASLARFGDSTVLLHIPLAPVAFALAGLAAVAALVGLWKLGRMAVRP